MSPLEPFSELIFECINEEFMEEGFSGTHDECFDVFMKKRYVPFYVPAYNILFIFRSLSREDEEYFPVAPSAEILMMGKSRGMDMVKSIKILRKIGFSCYPWLRVFARSKNKTLAALYGRMGMTPVASADGYSIYCLEK